MCRLRFGKNTIQLALRKANKHGVLCLLEMVAAKRKRHPLLPRRGPRRTFSRSWIICVFFFASWFVRSAAPLSGHRENEQWLTSDEGFTCSLRYFRFLWLTDVMTLCKSFTIVDWKLLLHVRNGPLYTFLSWVWSGLGLDIFTFKKHAYRTCFVFF